MKIQIDETEDDFSMLLESETPKEASTLARMAISKKRVAPRIETLFSRNGVVETYINIYKKIEFNAWIGEK